MSAGLGYQQSNQSSESTSGISRQFKDPLSSLAMNNARTLQGMSLDAARSPFGYFQGQHVNQMVPQNQFGLPVQTTQALEALGNQWFSRASAGGASRGQLQPENTPGVVGSALMNGAQWLVPQITQFQQYLHQLPDMLNSQRLGYLQANAGTQANLLGSKSDFKGNSFGFNAHGGYSG